MSTGIGRKATDRWRGTALLPPIDVRSVRTNRCDPIYFIDVLLNQNKDLVFLVMEKNELIAEVIRPNGIWL